MTKLPVVLDEETRQKRAEFLKQYARIEDNNHFKKEVNRMLKTKVTSIGKDAGSKEDGLIILFNETASDKLRDVSVIHEQLPDFEQKFDLQVGSLVAFDQQLFTVTYIGELVESNLMSIGHTIFDFHDVPAKPRANAIYLKPAGEPDVSVGTVITFGA